MEIFIGVILILVSVFLIISVLFQSSKNARLSGVIAGSAETFFGKSKGKTIDKKLSKVTVIISLIFAVIVLALYAFQPGKPKIKFDYDFLNNYIDGVKDGSIALTITPEQTEDDHNHGANDEETPETEGGETEGGETEGGTTEGGETEGGTTEGGETEGGTTEGGETEGGTGEGNPDDSTSNENLEN